jgi:hypothetical protein
MAALDVRFLDRFIDLHVMTPVQHAVGAAVAAHQEIVEIEGGQALAAALDLDVAEAAGRRWPPGAHQRLDHGGQAADAVGARLGNEAGDVHAQAAQLAERDTELEVAEHLRDALADRGRQVGIAHTGHQDRPDARDADAAAAIDQQPQIGIDRAPQCDQDLVAGLDQIVGRHQRTHVSGAFGIDRRHQFRTEASDAGRRLELRPERLAGGRRGQSLHECFEFAGLGLEGRQGLRPGSWG